MRKAAGAEAADFEGGYEDPVASAVPIPLPAVPAFKNATSHRIGERHKRKMSVWRLAVKLAAVVNSLHQGKVLEAAKQVAAHGRNVKVSPANIMAQKKLLKQTQGAPRFRPDWRPLQCTSAGYSPQVRCWR